MYVKFFVSTVITLALLLENVVADGTITEIRPEESALNLTVRTSLGEQYQLQGTTNLSAGVWEDIGEA